MDHWVPQPCSGQGSVGEAKPPGKGFGGGFDLQLWELIAQSTEAIGFASGAGA